MRRVVWHIDIRVYKRGFIPLLTQKRYYLFVIWSKENIGQTEQIMVTNAIFWGNNNTPTLIMPEQGE